MAPRPQKWPKLAKKDKITPKHHGNSSLVIWPKNIKNNLQNITFCSIRGTRQLLQQCNQYSTYLKGGSGGSIRNTPSENDRKTNFWHKLKEEVIGRMMYNTKHRFESWQLWLTQVEVGQKTVCVIGLCWVKQRKRTKNKDRGPPWGQNENQSVRKSNSKPVLASRARSIDSYLIVHGEPKGIGVQYSNSRPYRIVNGYISPPHPITCQLRTPCLPGWYKR